MVKETRKKVILTFAIIFGILLIDQFVKFYIKTHFYLGESVQVTDWFYIRFIENNGMAFGVELFDKIFLTVFRIVAVGAIGYYLYYIIVKKNYALGFILAVAAICAGAVGNIIDCVFYGVWFDSSLGKVAEFLPENGGYAPFFYGKVVDMLHFPLFDFVWPDWVPFFGGDNFTFFDPIFNIADSAICVSIVYILLFQHKYLLSEEKKSSESKTNDDEQIEEAI